MAEDRRARQALSVKLNGLRSAMATALLSRTETELYPVAHDKLASETLEPASSRHEAERQRKSLLFTTIAQDFNRLRRETGEACALVRQLYHRIEELQQALETVEGIRILALRDAVPEDPQEVERWLNDHVVDLERQVHNLVELPFVRLLNAIDAAAPRPSSVR